MCNTKSIQLILISAAILTMLIVSSALSNSVYAQNKFRAKLEPDNEVPPINSTAAGVATFKIKDEGIKSKINITGITDISGAQIFFGKIGQSNDPVVDLMKTGQRIENPGGVSIEGNFTTSDFEGSMKGKDLSALQSAMSANQTFVNIMTTEHPDGEMAGHIYSKGSTTGAQDNAVSTPNTEGVSEEGTGDNTSDLPESGFGEED